ncbi:MAG: hypothetical protein AAF292_16325 [Pseudomonadota bacterium]
MDTGRIGTNRIVDIDTMRSLNAILMDRQVLSLDQCGDAESRSIE